MDFWNLTAQVIPVILLALVLEARFMSTDKAWQQAATRRLRRNKGAFSKVAFHPLTRLLVYLLVAMSLLAIEGLALAAVMLDEEWPATLDSLKILVVAFTIIGFMYVVLLPMLESALTYVETLHREERD